MVSAKAALSVAIGAALSLFGSAAAASPNARLVYGRAPEAEECPDEAALRKAVGARIGYDPFFPHASRTVVVTIARKDKKLASRIELVDDTAHTGGARELSTVGPGCGELFESTALAVAIAIDPRALVAPVSSPPDPGTEPKPRPEPEPKSSPAALARTPEAEPGSEPAPRAGSEPASGAASGPEPLPSSTERADEKALRSPTSSRRTLNVRASVHMRGATGIQPSIALGAFFGVGLFGRRASIGIEAGSYLPSGAPRPAGGEARAWLTTGALVPCLRFDPISVCGIATVGRLEGSGENVTDARTDATPYVALGARTGVEVMVTGPLRVHVDGEALGNLTRTTLKVGNDEVWKAAPLAAAVSAGASFDFQ